MIEESGENWYYAADAERPSIQVVARIEQVERTETVERDGKKKRKRKKDKPFGFAQALPREG